MQAVKNYFIRVADFNIRLFTIANFSLKIDSIYKHFLVEKVDKLDLSIEVHQKIPRKYAASKLIFEAKHQKDGKNYVANFWTINKLESDFVVMSSHPEKPTFPYLLLRFRHDEKKWDLYIHNPDNQEVLNPFLYPMGALILYYLSSQNGGIMIHASGIEKNSIGRLFSGFSGVGKSTISNLWLQKSARVINDDRLIIRQLDGKYYMFNTPMYYQDVPKKAPLNQIFFLKHAKENTSQKLLGSDALSQLMAFCIQHLYDKELTQKHLHNLSQLVQKIPIYRLGFLPDRSIVKYLETNEFK